MFYVYILKSLSTGRFYIGSTEDTVNRLTEHNSGEVKATRSYRPWTIVYTETFSTRSEAYRRERQIKAWKNPDYMRKRLGINS
jgi:putative endonuclease